MRKNNILLLISVFLIVSVLVCPLYGETIDIPAPFCKAKEIALRMPADVDGDYIWGFVKNNDGQKVHYNLAYLGGQKTILISKEPVICGYIEDTKEMKCVVFVGYGFVPIDKPNQQIIEFCFAVFRDLVSAGAI